MSIYSNGKRVYASYEDGSDVYKDDKGYYIIDLNNKKYLGKHTYDYLDKMLVIYKKDIFSNRKAGSSSGRDNIDIKLKHFLKYIKVNDKPIFVFDIHKTALKKDGTKNEEIEKWIKKLKKDDYNIFFLSYDGQEKRIYENAKLLDKIKTYKDIPKIFMMQRKKHLVLYNLEKLIKVDKKYKIKATLIDDNPLNIKDVGKLDKEKFESHLYK